MSHSRYEVDPGKWAPGSSHDWLYRGALNAGRVLDVGCATGGLGAALLAGGSNVVGVDIDAVAVQEARRRGIDARVIDLESTLLSEELQGELFDCVVIGDVLEHLLDPGRVLSDVRKLLLSTGYVMVSVPNASHASIILGLILNRWDSRDVGLLDRTHLRFFTLESFTDLAESCGYVVSRVERVISDVADPTQTSTLAMRGVDLVAKDLVDAAKTAAEASTLQFVCRLDLIDPCVDDVSLARQLVVDARIATRDVTRENIKLQSRITQLQSREALYTAAIHDFLRQKDEIMGLEAERAALRITARELRLTAEQNEQHRIMQIAAIQGSMTWLVGRMATYPFRILRHALQRFFGGKH